MFRYFRIESRNNKTALLVYQNEAVSILTATNSFWSVFVGFFSLNHKIVLPISNVKC